MQTISTQVGEIDHPGCSLPLGGRGQVVKNLLIPHTWKKNSPSHMENPPVSRLPPLPSHPTPHFYFPKQVSQSLWTGRGILKISTGTELSLWIGQGAWDKTPTVREIYKLDDIAYFGKFSKSGEKNTLLRLSNSWYQHLWILLRLFYRIYKDGSSICQLFMRSLNCAIKKIFVATLPN